jgi:autotransporter translocation and assembly factor TamB
MAWAGLAFVCLMVVAFVVSQTPWFKDWLRRYAVERLRPFLNAELSIGRLSGSLYEGVVLEDVVLRQEGRPVISIPRASVDYSARDLVSGGLVLKQVRLERPSVLMIQGKEGLNLARLIRRDEREDERRGPGRPLSIGRITIVDGRVATEGMGLPERIEQLSADLSLDYRPVDITLTFAQLSFSGASPQLNLQSLTGVVGIENRNLRLGRLAVRTAESEGKIDGIVREFAHRASLELSIDATRLSLPEIGRFLPVVDGMPIVTTLRARAAGPLDTLALEIAAESNAGGAQGTLTADLVGPDRALAGTLRLTRVDLAPILDDPASRSRITGQARFDLRFPATGAINGPFTFTGPEAVAYGYGAQQVDGRFRLEGRRIRLIAVRGRAYGASATARGTIDFPTSKPARPLTLDLEGEIAGLDLRQLPSQLPVPALASELRGAYRTHLVGRAIKASVELNESTLEGATFADGTIARLTWDGKTLGYGGQGYVTGLDLRRLGRALEIDVLDADRYTGALTGDFVLDGSGTTLGTLRLAARGTLVDSSIGGARVPRATFEARLSESRLDVTANGEFADVDPAVFGLSSTQPVRLNGNADIVLALTNLAAPLTSETFAIRGRVDLRDSAAGALRIAMAEADFDFANEVATVRKITLSGAGFTGEGSGTLAMDDATNSDFTFRFDVRDLAPVGDLAGLPLKGSATVDGRATGLYDALRVAGTVVGHRLAHGDVAEALSARSTFDVRTPQLGLGRMTLKAETEAGFLKIRGVDFAGLTLQSTLAGDALTFDATIKDPRRTGTAAGQLLLHGDHQEVHLRALSLESGNQRWQLAPGATPALQYGNDMLSVQGLALEQGDQRVRAEGTLGLTAGAVGTLDVVVENVDLAQIDRLLVENPRYGGRFDATAKVIGSIPSMSVDSTIAIRQGTIQQVAYESLTGRVSYQDERFTVDIRLQQSPQEWLTTKGTFAATLLQPSPPEGRAHVDASENDQVDLRIESSPVSLGLIQGFTDVVTDVKGFLQANVHIVGSGRDPHIAGFVDVREAAFVVQATGAPYTGVTTRLQFDAERLNVTGLKMLDADGDVLTLEGALALHPTGGPTADIRVQATRFEILDNELGDVDVDANLRFVGDLRRPKLDGEVTFVSGRIELDRVLQRYAFQPYSTEALSELPLLASPFGGGGDIMDELAEEFGETAEGLPDPSQGLWRVLALDLRLRMPDNLVVRGTDLRIGAISMGLGDVNVTLGGSVRLQKAPFGGPTLVGAVTIVRGNYSFQGRRFELQRDGRLHFAGLDPPDPSIDITGEREIAGIKTRVRVVGTLGAPQLVLSSDPPLDPGDILALIAFNTPINQLGTAQRVSLAERAGALAAGFLVAPLTDSLARSLDIDIIEVATSQDGTGAALTIGQQLNDRVFVRFRQEFGQAQLSEFTVELRLTDFMRVQSILSEGDDVFTRGFYRRVERAGIDLIFFWAF